MELTQEELNILGATFLFKGVPIQQLEELLARSGGKLKLYRRDAIIFDPEHFRNELGILLSGRVRVSKGDGGLVVSELHQGDLFGAAALFNEETAYVSTLTARSPTRILFLTQGAVQQMLDCSPMVQRNYIRYLSGRIRFLSGKIDALIRGTGERKLSDYLLRRMDGNGRVQLECSMTELAARLNIGRATLYREMQKLEDGGILTRTGKTIVIKRPELLSGRG